MQSADSVSPVDLVRHLFAARSIAIVGASSNGLKAAGRTLRYLVMHGFQGEIYPVNPSRDEVQGLRCHAALSELPVVPELAVVVVQASEVAPAIAECGELGVPVVIVFASGFAETGPEGAALQDEVAAVARRYGVRVLGPNCNGVIGAADGVTATFMTGIDDESLVLRDDGIAFVTQSGAMGAFILTEAQTSGIGLGRFVSTGNEMDISLAEVVEGLVQDDATKVVLGYVEGVRTPQRLRQALATARANGVPVCLMKVGRSRAGAAAAASHTGALAGADAVFDGLLAQYGAVRAHDVDHLLDLGRVFGLSARPKGGRLTVITLSGGAGVLMADAIEDHGLSLAPWDRAWAERMAAVLPAFASVRNPIDVTGALVTDPELLRKALDVAIEHPDTDIITVLVGNMQRQEDQVCEIVESAAARTDRPIVTVWVGGTGRAVPRLARAGLVGFTEPVRAIRALSSLVRFWAPAESTPTTSAADPHDEPVPTPGRVVDEVEVKRLLAAHGVPVVAEDEVTTAEEAAATAARLGFPSVVKILSTEVAHKSDLGLVQVGLVDADQVRAAADRILAAAERHDVTDRRLVVQPMISSDTELILGMRRDPVFGPVVVLGIGGVLTEIAADVQVRLPPLTSDDAHAMMNRLRYAELLDGPRGRVAVDRDALAAAVVSFSELVARETADLESLEINPLLIDDSGRPVAVDALLVRSSSAVGGRGDFR
ncbi:acetate--CoA ligase family protein [Nocardioides albus]|uniref:Acyl-CoA synthetase (NDP forming) n=1 Tax=Nocardioides albus TaxID=1841 RepID=A0A7W5A183_9ACTN|nr:acetate--CoA ligase family protein [Nocardioides albus]MBB3087618.1 acyl-CoA synthetase (NDP forming) [Nocardioides albus]GGU10305.1 pimeloyl-CoA synthetase [Nocardioides albus]